MLVENVHSNHCWKSTRSKRCANNVLVEVEGILNALLQMGLILLLQTCLVGQCDASLLQVAYAPESVGQQRWCQSQVLAD